MPLLMENRPVCIFCGRTSDEIELVPAELRAQCGLWACTDHLRTDGWVNRPHEGPPFDAGYPHSLIVPIPDLPNLPILEPMPFTAKARSA